MVHVGPEYAEGWPHYQLDTIPDALQKIGELVLARQDSQAANYAEMQLQNAHTRIAQLEAALKEIGDTWQRTGESRELRDTIVHLTAEFYPL